MKAYVHNAKHLELLTRTNQHDRLAGTLGILPNHLIQLLRLTNPKELSQIVNDLRFTTFWATDHVSNHPSVLGQPVTRLYLRRDKDPPLRRKNQAESCCECDSAQVLQTKRSFFWECCYFQKISLPESHRWPTSHQKWGQVEPLLLEG